MKKEIENIRIEKEEKQNDKKQNKKIDSAFAITNFVLDTNYVLLIIIIIYYNEKVFTIQLQLES